MSQTGPLLQESEFRGRESENGKERKWDTGARREENGSPIRGLRYNTTVKCSANNSVLYSRALLTIIG